MYPLLNTVGFLHIGIDCTNQASCTAGNVVVVAATATIVMISAGGAVTAIATHATLAPAQS